MKVCYKNNCQFNLTFCWRNIFTNWMDMKGGHESYALKTGTNWIPSIHKKVVIEIQFNSMA